MKKFFIKISALIAITFTLIAGALITLKFSGREVYAQEYSSGSVELNYLRVGDVIKRGTTVTGPNSVWTVQIDKDYKQIDPTDSYYPDSFVADRRYTVIWNNTAGNPKTLYLTKHVGVEKEVAVDTEWYFGDTFVLNGATWLKVGEDGTLQPKANIGAGKYVVPWPASNSGKWYCFQNMFGGNSFNVIDNRTGWGASGGFKCTGGDGTEDNPYTFELIDKPDFSDEAVADEDAAAIVGDKNYATLKDAVAACPEDGTVKLLANIDLSSEVPTNGRSITVSNSMTIDLNGHTIFVSDGNNQTGLAASGGSVTLLSSAQKPGKIGCALGLGVGDGSKYYFANVYTKLSELVFENDLHNPMNGYEAYALEETDPLYAEGYRTRVSVGNFVAKVANTRYETLVAAIEACPADETIKLLKDLNLGTNTIEVTKNVTIDLNGHILSSATTGTSGLRIIGNYDLTIFNGKDELGKLNCNVGADGEANTAKIYLGNVYSLIQVSVFSAEDTHYFEMDGYKAYALEETDPLYAEGYRTRIDEAPMEGDGSQENPYLIRTETHLRQFADMVENSGPYDNYGKSNICGKLIADIDTVGSMMNPTYWEPMGSGDHPYNGTFDGNGHEVRIRVYLTENTQAGGFFALLYDDAVVKNLTVSGMVAVDAGESAVGGIAGICMGQVINCVNKASIEASSYYAKNAGGIVGECYYNETVLISRCVNEGTVDAPTIAGGIVGYMSIGTVTDCYNVGIVRTMHDSEDRCGGIVGYLDGGYVTNCFSYGRNASAYPYTITNVDSVGVIAKTAMYGGVIGNVSSSFRGAISHNYYLKDSVGTRAGYGGDFVVTNGGFNTEDVENKAEMLTAEQFKAAASFVDWDFNGVWMMGENHPVLAPEHAHNLTYVANAETATITATCDAEGCPVENHTATLTIYAPSNLYYNGKPKTCTLTENYNTSFFPNITIAYFDANHHEIQNAVDVGTYSALLSTDTAYVTIEFEIVENPNFIYVIKLTEDMIPDNDELFSITDYPNFKEIDEDLAKTWECLEPTGKCGLIFLSNGKHVYYVNGTYDSIGNMNSRLTNGDVRWMLSQFALYYTAYRKGEEGYTHVHNLTYTANGDTITATCSESDCPNPTGTLKLLAPTTTEVNKDSQLEISFEEGYDETLFRKIAVKYYLNDVLVEKANKVGHYVAKVTFGTATAEVEFDITAVNHIHNDVAFTAWTSTNSLPTEAGNYYLTNDVTLSSTWNVPSGTTNLCLNGHGIKMTGSTRVIYLNGAILNLFDCDDTTEHKYTISNPIQGAGLAVVNDNAAGAGVKTFVGGYITGAKTSDKGAVISIEGGGKFVLNGGTIIGNTTSAGHGGGAIALLGWNNNQFIMNGGALIGNTTSGGWGGAIYLHEGASVTINGGVIKENYAAKNGNGAGGGISAEGSGNLIITGGAIINNAADHHGGNINFANNIQLSGNVTITGGKNKSGAEDNIFINGNRVLNIVGELDKKSSIHFTTSNVVVTSGWSTYMLNEHPEDYFGSDVTGKYVGLKNGEAALFAKEQIVRIGGNTYESLAAAYEAAQEDDVIVLLVNIDLSQINSTNYLDVKKNVGLDLNGYILKFSYTATSSQITLSGSKVITIDNSKPETGGILGAVGVAQDGSYLLIKNARLAFTTEQLEATSTINRIASGYMAKNINKDGTPDTNGFITIVEIIPYKPLDKDTEIEIKDGDKETADPGDTLTVDTDANPIEVEWFYDDNGDGNPDDEFDPIGREKEYTVKPQDQGHTIIVVIKQREKEDGTDYPEGEIPTVTSEPFVVNVLEKYFEVNGETYHDLKDAYDHTNAGDTIKFLKDYDMSKHTYPYLTIAHDVKLDLNGHKLYGSSIVVVDSNVTLTLDNSVPATGGIAGGISYSTGIIKLFNIRMDVSADEINIHYTERFSTAQGYEAVKIKEDGTADENGYYAIVQPKTGAPEGVYEGGKTYTLVSAWYLDDMNKFYGTPEEIPAGEYIVDNDGYTKQKYYTFVFHNEDYSVKYFINIESPELAQAPNAFVITGGTGTESDPYTMGLVVPYVPLDTTKDLIIEIPDGKENPSDGDKLKVTVDGTNLTIEWYYDDNKDGIPDNPSQPLPKGKNDKDNEYTVRFVDLYNLQHSDYEHNIIAVVKQNIDENGYEYNDKPTLISNTVEISKVVPDIKKVYVGEVFLLGEYVFLDSKAYIKLDSSHDNVEIAVGGYKVPNKWNAGEGIYTLSDMFKTTADNIESLSIPYVAGEYIGIMCVSGTGTNGDPFVFEAILADSYIPLNTNRAVEIEKPRKDIVRNGDELTVHTPASPVEIKWYYTGTNGQPEGEPIATGETYTAKLPDDQGKNIVAVITQPKKSDGTDYPEGQVPTVTTGAVNIGEIKTQLKIGSVYLFGDYVVLTAATHIKCNEWADSHEIPAGEYVLNRFTYSVKQFHFANMFGNVRLSIDETSSLPLSKAVGIRCVSGSGVVGDPFVFEMAYNYKLDPETEITITVPEDKEEVEKDDELTVDVNAEPITIEWFYDDDNDGNPDDPRNPIGTGKTYIVKCPDEKDPTHDDTGHTIIAVVKQDKRPDGTGLPDEEVVTKTTPGVKVKEPKEIKKGEDFFKDDLISFEDNTYVYVYYVNGKEKVSAEIKAGTYKVTLNVTKQDEPLSYVFAALFKDSNDKDVDLTTISFSGTYVPADEIVGLRCVGGKGTEELPYILVATIKTDYYIPLNPEEKTPINKPDHEPLYDGDEIEVDTDATGVSVEWYYDDNEDGLPDDPANPIGTGMTYTVKTPDKDNPTHDDRGHKIIAKVTQEKDKDGNDIPQDKRPVQYSLPVEVYTPFIPNPEQKPEIEVPEDREQAKEGDVLGIDFEGINGDPVTVKWYYDDDNDGLPDDPEHPIGEGETYTVVCPDPNNENHNDRGHTIIGEITQEKKPDGTDYPEGEAPKDYTKPVKVEGKLPVEMDVKPGKFYLIGDTINFKENAVIDNNNENPISTKAGKVLVTCHVSINGDEIVFENMVSNLTDEKVSLHVLAKSQTISADQIVGLKCVSGDGSPDNPFVFIAVKEDELYTPLNPEEKTTLIIPNHDPLIDGDELEVLSEASEITVEWFYDDDNDGLPDDPANPVGTGMTYTVKCPDPDNPNHDDRGHNIIARVTQNMDENGENYPEGEKPTQYSNPVEIYKPLDPNPETKPEIDVPDDKEEVSNGDELHIDVKSDPVIIKWYYDDDQDGLPDDPSHPIAEGDTYTVICPDPNNENHNDRGHTIIGEITQPTKPDGTAYPEGEVPTVYTKPVKVEGKLPETKKIQVGKYYLIGDKVNIEAEAVVDNNTLNPIVAKVQEVLVTCHVTYLDGVVIFENMILNSDSELSSLHVLPVSEVTSASDIVGIKCVSGDGTVDNPYKFIAVTEADLFSPLNPEAKPELVKPEHTPVYDGEELEVIISSTDTIVKWYYDDNQDGLPDDPENPIAIGEKYQIKTPNPDDPNHDDTGHTIIAVVKQNFDENGDPYEEDKKPTQYSDPVEVFAPLSPNPETKPEIDVPDDKTKAQDGDVLSVEVDSKPVDIKWYYDDNNDGIPDNPESPIGEGATYKVVCPELGNDNHDDTGHTIIAVFTQNKKPDGTDYPEGEAPTQTTKPVKVDGTIPSSYVPLIPSVRPIIDTPEHEPLFDGDEITLRTGATDVTVKWYYDDNYDGKPDDPENPIGEGKKYQVVCPDSNNPEHDDRGHYIIAVITQNTDKDGNPYEEGAKPTQYSKQVRVYTPLNQDEEIMVVKPVRELTDNDTLEAYTLASNVDVKWYYDDNNDGIPDDLSSPIGEGKKYSLKCPDKSNPDHDDRGHNIIAVITQTKDEKGLEIAEDERVSVTSEAVFVKAHEHSFTYVAIGRTITATCNTYNCLVHDGFTLTLVGPTDLVYDGEAKVVTFVEGYSDIVFPNAKVKYYKDNQEVESCIESGTYVAKVTFGDATAQYTFTILNWTMSDKNVVEAEVIGLPEDTNIKIQVEIKTTVSAEEKSAEYKNINDKLESNEEITKVYEVKLIRTVDGVETEIQPSDIQEGIEITVSMVLPEDAASGKFKILHIHSADDMEFITDYEITKNIVTFKVSRFSEFAFIVNKAAHGFCMGWVLFIFVFLEASFLCLYVASLFIDKLGLKAKKEFLENIGLFSSMGVLALAIVTVMLEVCVISIISYAFALVFVLFYMVLVFLRIKRIRKLAA